jgi:acyl-CoA synthetase (AMP-forming)/AMP-acid ligase II
MTDRHSDASVAHLPIYKTAPLGLVTDQARVLLEQVPDRVLVIDGDNAVTVREIWDEACILVQAFRDRGLKPGDVVAMQLPNWSEVMSIYLAISMAGLILNPILPILRDSEVKFMLRDSRSKLFFIPAEFRGYDFAEMTRRIRVDLPDLADVVVLRGDVREGETAWTDILGKGTAATEFEAIDPDSVKIVMYTSGTTGRPKGVLHSQRSLRAEVESYVSYWNMDERDVVFMASPVSHITGCLGACELPWAIGGPVVLQDKWSANEAVDLFIRHGVTYTAASTPFLAELLAAAQARDEHLPAFRRFTCGGMAIPPQLIRDAHNWFPNAVVGRCFGMSEVPSITLAIAERDDIDNGADTDGRLAPGVEVRIVDAQTGVPCPLGEEGEIVVKAPEQFVGYLRAEDNADAYDENGFFRTGDIGVLTQDQCLIITGRKKDLIIRGGENLSAKEIEDALLEHAAIADVAVVAFPHERLGEGVGCFVVLKPGATLTQPAMADFLVGTGLAKQKIPERLEFIDALPRNFQGKVQKNVLRDLMKVPGGTGTGQAAPATTAV